MLAPLHEADAPEQGHDGSLYLRADGAIRQARLEDPLANPGKAGGALAPVGAEEVDARPRRQQASELGMVEVDGLLNERQVVSWIDKPPATFPGSSRSREARRCALRRASFRAESSGRWPSRSQVRSSPRRVPE